MGDIHETFFTSLHPQYLAQHLTEAQHVWGTECRTRGRFSDGPGRGKRMGVSFIRKTGEQSDEATCQEAGSRVGSGAPSSTPSFPRGRAGAPGSSGDLAGMQRKPPFLSQLILSQLSGVGVDFSLRLGLIQSLPICLLPRTSVAGAAVSGWSYLPGQEPAKSLWRFGPISEKLMKTTLPW